MNRAVRTVATNLAEGALLVVLVLLLVLGNVRAGLVVSVTIPLALLFAVLAMRVFGISGNLMSLGAIDFGLMVDGAVIIVENAVRRLSEHERERGRPLSASERTAIVRVATLEVRSASVFGEIIIAVVYLPVLALTGIEGKLFRPMAATVLLALAGSFVLSLTLIPVLTSLFVRARREHTETWLVRLVTAAYTPLLAAATRRRALTIGFAVVVVAGAVALFGRIGAEFLPQLDEGDLLVEARRLPGVALSESVAMDGRMQKALLKIPEIEHVVSKTGAPEIATDPMGLQQTDVYIALRERGAWRRGVSRESLAREISETLERAVPEVVGAISQPIQMRTNELIAGIRSDVALILYGRDLDDLAALGERAARILRPIRGAVDVRVEPMAGLEYLRIVPDRVRLARHGLAVADVNAVVETLAVGHSAGEVLEEERRHALVVRTDPSATRDLEAIRTLPVASEGGVLVPLGDVATVEFVNGPAEVNRSQQSRRLVVEFNVRERDLMAVVDDARRAIDRELPLPRGYRLEWGGEFEHYVEGKARLALVVPLALALILFLLWLAFRSARAALVVFLNVPFAIVGGVVALWLRQIPFSISAGIGFIALFGVAVLNGLVLVAFARHLEAEGATPGDAIRRAAEQRLRPVLMTALVASLGFVPMALSTSPGSEVQRPLATVVIGGLVTATLLTMVALPVLYGWLTRARAS